MATLLNTEHSVIINHYEELLAKIESGTANVAVIGMGYVGLPNMVDKANNGYNVTGYDLDEFRVGYINSGNSYIKDVKSEVLEKHVDENRISATTDFSLLYKEDVIVICVPTPIDKFKQPDLSFIKKVTIEIAKYAKEGTLVILESTTYPQTTEDYIVASLNSKGLKVGENIFIAYSPERIDPSNETFNVANTPRVVGGHTEKCSLLAEKFIGNNVTVVSSTKVAELTKVFENTFRFVNIALVNELAVICDNMGVDTWEVLEACATKPFGFMPFSPTVGIGGHCIPVDPYYLSWYVKQYNINSNMIELAGGINDNMNDFFVSKISRILNDNKRSLNGSRIAIIGASYKKDIADVRNSPVLRLYGELDSLGADTTIYDPYVKCININGKDINIKNVEYHKLNHFDLVILLTDHSVLDYKKIGLKSRILLDTKNAFKDVMKKGDYYKL